VHLPVITHTQKKNALYKAHLLTNR